MRRKEKPVFGLEGLKTGFSFCVKGDENLQIKHLKEVCNVIYEFTEVGLKR